MTDSTPPPPPPEPSAGQPAGQPVAAQPLSDSDARLWVTLSHIGTILFGFVPALIFWLMGKDRSKFVSDEAKEALNFGILITAMYVIGWILSIVLIGFLLVLAAFVLSLIFCIQGAMKANKGETYRYPLNVRLVK
ncbi:DUF4870 domain-containing protein [Demequina aurantiaca]|uniref:DUF4870 domain-containing protein n=1 Tax=Demequina aurantiaca TaxID=676200 RepID=UPI003D34104D